MTEQEELYFSKLTEEREGIVLALEKPVLKGVHDSVIEKYSGKPHFIYELLQDADDAGATEARFVLYPDKLVFAHNGSRHFSISDPAKEDITGNNRLGNPQENPLFLVIGCYFPLKIGCYFPL